MQVFWAAYKDGFRKYARFEGRTSRASFWRFVTIDLVLNIAPVLLVGLVTAGQESGDTSALAVLGGLYFVGYTIAALLPRLAIGARRLHDTGRSAWWLLLLFASVVGWIVFVVFVAEHSRHLDNPYGPAPEDSTSPSGRVGQEARPDVTGTAIMRPDHAGTPLDAAPHARPSGTGRARSGRPGATHRDRQHERSQSSTPVDEAPDFAPADPVEGSVQRSTNERLRELEELRDAGLVTDDEYQSRRSAILDAI